MGSPMSSILAKIYMEQMESEALSIFKGKTPSQWFSYVDETWVTIKTQ